MITVLFNPTGLLEDETDHLLSWSGFAPEIVGNTFELLNDNYPRINVTKKRVEECLKTAYGFPVHEMQGKIQSNGIYQSTIRDEEEEDENLIPIARVEYVGEGVISCVAYIYYYGIVAIKTPMTEWYITRID